MQKSGRIIFSCVIVFLYLESVVIAQNAIAAGGQAGAETPARRGVMAGLGGRGMMGRGGSVSVRSPEILSDRRVTFRIFAPQATSVSVRGDWNSIPASEIAVPSSTDSVAANAGTRGRGMAGMGMAGSGAGGTQMTKDDTGVWSVTVGPLNSELFGYTFNVDGATVWDPVNLELKRDGTRIESVLIVPGQRGDLYSVRDVSHGTLAKVWYDSPTLNMKRRMYVYLPPGYETSGEKYPVLYLLHGAGGDEDAWTSLGRTPEILDNLIAQGKAVPMLVVMTNGNATQAASPDVIPASSNRGGFGGAGGVRRGGGMNFGGLFVDSLAKDVVPFIEKNYRVISDRRHRAVAGLSMGGGHTISVTNANPYMFNYIGVMSMGSTDPNLFDSLSRAKPKLYWVACGRDDSLVTSARSLVDILKNKGFSFAYFESTGAHAWYNWRIYLTRFAPMLFK